MAKVTVRVTPAQKMAAQGLVRRSAQTGRAASETVRKIANASRPVPTQPSTSQPGSPLTDGA